MDNNVDTNNIDIYTIDINIDINSNDTNNIDKYIKSIDLSNFEKIFFSIFDENFDRFKMDRNYMLMSSYFACAYVFEPNFVNLILKIRENSKKNRFYRFFDQVKI